MLARQGICHEIDPALYVANVVSPISYFHNVAFCDWVVSLAVLISESTYYGEVISPYSKPSPIYFIYEMADPLSYS